MGTSLPHPALKELLHSFSGEDGVAVMDPVGDDRFAFQAERRFPTPSAFKVPSMVELFRQAEVGALRFKDVHEAHDGFALHGSRSGACVPGSRWSLEALCARMIVGSDNIGADVGAALTLADESDGTRPDLPLIAEPTRAAGGTIHPDVAIN